MDVKVFVVQRYFRNYRCARPDPSRSYMKTKFNSLLLVWTRNLNWKMQMQIISIGHSVDLRVQFLSPITTIASQKSSILSTYASKLVLWCQKYWLKIARCLIVSFLILFFVLKAFFAFKQPTIEHLVFKSLIGQVIHRPMVVSFKILHFIRKCAFT